MQLKKQETQREFQSVVVHWKTANIINGFLASMRLISETDFAVCQVGREYYVEGATGAKSSSDFF